MCEECDRIDGMIEHYREMLDPDVDKFTQGMVGALIADLQVDKAKLHPAKKN